MDNNEIAKNIACKICEWRAKTSVSRAELADLVDADYKSVWMWENGFGCPNIRFLVPLATALGCTVDELLHG